MNSLFMFGGNGKFLSRLLDALKLGGTFCLGSECFNKEPDERATALFDFDFQWDVWDNCFSKYHYPEWWKALLEKTGKLKIDYCEELDDAKALWEDLADNYGDYFGELPNADDMIPRDKMIELIEYGKHNDVCLSLFILCGQKA